jgi:hypothetical protein
LPLLYPVTTVFAVIRRTPSAEGNDAFKILAVYTSEEQASQLAQQLNGTDPGASDGYFYYVAADLIDPRQT